MTHPDRAIKAGARAAARVNGDDYDAIPADKPEWIRESGHFGGRDEEGL